MKVVKLAATIVSLISLVMFPVFAQEQVSQEPEITPEPSRTFTITKEDFIRVFNEQKKSEVNGPKIQNIPLESIGAAYKGLTLQVIPDVVTQEVGTALTLDVIIKNVSTKKIAFIEVGTVPTDCTFFPIMSDFDGEKLLNKYYVEEGGHLCIATRPPSEVWLEPGSTEGDKYCWIKRLALKKVVCILW